MMKYKTEPSTGKKRTVKHHIILFDPVSHVLIYYQWNKSLFFDNMNIMNWLSSLFGLKLDRSSSKAIQGSVIPSERENSTPYSQKRRYPRFLVTSMDIQSEIIRAEPIQLSNISPRSNHYQNAFILWQESSHQN